MADRSISLGIMQIDVTGRASERLTRLTERASARFTDTLKPETRLAVRNFQLSEPSLTPGDAGYDALDFVQLGINEKTERRLAFLILVTEVEISAASFSYLLALPSQLTNVAIISTRRLAELGTPEADNEDLLADRLGTLMVHCFGRLVNLDYVSGQPANYLYALDSPDDLDAMVRFTDAQFATIKANLPLEANDRFSEGNTTLFFLSQTLANLPRIIRGALRSNPLRIATKLPTMIATALSVIIIMIFGAETWDFAAAVRPDQLSVFSVAAFFLSTLILYRAFSFKLVSTRNGSTSESSVVTAAATYLALFLTLLVLFVAFGLLMYGIIVYVFPDALMSTWTTDTDGNSFNTHVQLSIFLAAVGVLSGSLGGSSDTRSVVRNVLFATDET